MVISNEIRVQFSEAIEQGKIDLLVEIAKRHHDLLENGWSGAGPSINLTLAIENKQFEVCECLLRLGAEINATSPKIGDPVALFHAAADNNIEGVRWLLENGANPDGAPDAPYTPLMAAASAGNKEIALILISFGAEINREHLQLPQTALDAAIAYQFQNTGQDVVATLLREHGGVRPYTEVHDWGGVPGQRYIEHIERAIGAIVNPLTASETPLSSGNTLVIRKVRIPVTPTKFDFQLLFTVGLFTTGLELALCLPSAWPLNQSSLKESYFAWPLQLLNQVGRDIANGSELAHGDLINTDSFSLTDVGVPESIKQWIVSINQQIEMEREDDYLIPRTLILSPITSKKLIKPGAEALVLADKRRQAKWKALALAL